MANVDFGALSTEFADNRIVLVNGSELVCYPKVVQPESIIEDKLSLDKTGEYLRVGSKPVVVAERTDKEDLKEFFYKNAFLFFRNAHRILADSRMFLAPVPVLNGLMYVGTSGFQCPTLGVYVEWWLNCEADVTKDEKGDDALTCRIAGSPLSGSNRCTCVYPNGEKGVISFWSFSKVWRTFMMLNERYNAAKQMYEAYTLHEVVELLQAEGQSRESELKTQLDIAEGRMNTLRRLYSQLEERYNELQCKYNDLVIIHYKDELEDFRVEYCKRKHEAEVEMESLDLQKSEYRKQMKQGLINQVEYQHAIAPLRKRKQAIEQELFVFKSDRTDAMEEKGYITSSQIEDYIDSDD